MNSTDDPRHPRPLSGSGSDSPETAVPGTPRQSDQSGAARPPGELLDELRHRLRMLPDTHPSSVRDGRDRPAEDADQPVPDRWEATDEPAPVDPDDGKGDQA